LGVTGSFTVDEREGGTKFFRKKKNQKKEESPLNATSATTPRRKKITLFRKIRRGEKKTRGRGGAGEPRPLFEWNKRGENGRVALQ